jgi:hypothetical protein
MKVEHGRMTFLHYEDFTFCDDMHTDAVREIEAIHTLANRTGNRILIAHLARVEAEIVDVIQYGRPPLQRSLRKGQGGGNETLYPVRHGLVFAIYTIARMQGQERECVVILSAGLYEQRKEIIRSARSRAPDLK